MKKSITLYSIPNLQKVSGGPVSRISSIKNLLSEDKKNQIIVTNGLQKVLKSIKSSPSDVLYIESSTNRCKLVDFIALMILKRKSKIVVVYIRDIYFEMFPDLYEGIFNKIRSHLNKVSLRFYTKISKYLAFPTVEMAEKFYFYHPKFKRIETFELPPAIDRNHHCQFPNFQGENINFLYLGALNYKYSGLSEYIYLSRNLSGNFKFFMLSKDSVNSNENPQLIANYIPKDQLGEFINKNNIHFLVHSRPRNKYDDITYPIKIFDSISFKLPIISLPHPPLVRLLGHDYPFFLKKLDVESILSVVRRIKEEPEVYYDIKIRYDEISSKRSYKMLVEKLHQLQ